MKRAAIILVLAGLLAVPATASAASHVTVATSSTYWRLINGKPYPCRDGKVTIQKTARTFHWAVWQRLTVCTVTPRPGVTWTWRYMLRAGARAYNSRVGNIAWDITDWGCLGRRCTLYGVGRTYSMHKASQTWYPHIAMTWRVPDGSSRLRFSYSTRCRFC